MNLWSPELRCLLKRWDHDFLWNANGSVRRANRRIARHFEDNCEVHGRCWGVMKRVEGRE